MKNLFRNLFSTESAENYVHRKDGSAEPVVVVSGLPRSGTSMMMKMLDAGGLDIVQDMIREADQDNPKGYYEFERVKQMDKGDTAWVADARGKAVKVISALLQYLPSEYDYYVIFMRRDMEEILASQRKMLVNRQEDDAAVSDDEMAQLFETHVQQILGWLDQQPNFHTLVVNFNAMVADPEPDIVRMLDFLPLELDSDRMAEVVDPDLYRNRSAA